MSAVTQSLWTIVHLPFHIALVLLSEGTTQWAVWWRAVESFRAAQHRLFDSVQEARKSLDTSEVVEALQETAEKILKRYGSDVSEGGEDAEALEDAFEEIGDISDSFWATMPATDPDYPTWIENYVTVSSTVFNAISDAFDISVESEEDAATAANSTVNPELQAVEKTGERLVLVVSVLFVFVSYLLKGKN